MSKQLVRIDRSTFRKNPKYGSQKHLVPGAKRVDLRLNIDGVDLSFASDGELTFGASDSQPDVAGRFLLTKARCFVPSSCNDDSPPLGAMLYNVGGFYDVQFFPSEKKVVIDNKTYTVQEFDVEVERDVVCVDHDEPRWLFRYEPTQVTCDACGATFDHKRLKSSSAYDDDSREEWFSDTICPVCGEWDCCELEYENPNAVARELGLITFGESS